MADLSTTAQIARTLINRASRIDLYGQLVHNGGSDALEAPWCSNTADDLRAASSRLIELHEMLGELGKAVANYRHLHDRLGGDHIDTGRAWDVLRRAEGKALTVFAARAQPKAAP
jgi:hypothetical protein